MMTSHSKQFPTLEKSVAELICSLATDQNEHNVEVTIACLGVDRVLDYMFDAGIEINIRNNEIIMHSIDTVWGYRKLYELLSHLEWLSQQKSP